LRGHTKFVAGLAFSPDGKHLASTGQDKTIRVWKVTTGEELARMDLSGEVYNKLLWLPDGKTIVSAEGDGSLRLLDAGSGKAFAQLEIEQKKDRKKGPGSFVAFAGAIPANFRPFLDVACSRDGKTLVTARDSELQLDVWDLTKRRVVRELTGHRNRACYV